MSILCYVSLCKIILRSCLFKLGLGTKLGLKLRSWTASRFQAALITVFSAGFVIYFKAAIHGLHAPGRPNTLALHLKLHHFKPCNADKLSKSCFNDSWASTIICCRHWWGLADLTFEISSIARLAVIISVNFVMESRAFSTIIGDLSAKWQSLGQNTSSRL